MWKAELKSLKPGGISIIQELPSIKISYDYLPHRSGNWTSSATLLNPETTDSHAVITYTSAMQGARGRSSSSRLLGEDHQSSFRRVSWRLRGQWRNAPSPQPEQYSTSDPARTNFSLPRHCPFSCSWEHKTRPHTHPQHSGGDFSQSSFSTTNGDREELPRSNERLS